VLGGVAAGAGARGGEMNQALYAHMNIKRKMKKKKKRRSQVQELPELHMELETSLGYIQDPVSKI
jgi:hypothetical protein